MRKLLFAFVCFASLAMGQQPPNNPVMFTGASIGTALVECRSLNGPIGPLKDCRLVNGATLDQLANEVNQEQNRMKAAYAKMSERYFHCEGIYWYLFGDDDAPLWE
jgi:hypothetical protein